MIKTWQQRCEGHPDHEGIETEQMIRERMQEEIDELRQALAQPVDNVYICEKCVHKTEKSIHEPVAWMKSSGLISPYKHGSYQTPLYAAPSKKEWVGLSDEEINSCNKFITDWGQPCVWLWDDDLKEGGVQFARAIEDKLKEKNSA